MEQFRQIKYEKKDIYEYKNILMSESTDTMILGEKDQLLYFAIARRCYLKKIEFIINNYKVTSNVIEINMDGIFNNIKEKIPKFKSDSEIGKMTYALHNNILNVQWDIYISEIEVMGDLAIMIDDVYKKYFSLK